MEQACSEVKCFLRSAAARTIKSLNQAIAQALQSITPADAKAWFSHCGYGLSKGYAL